MISRYILSGLVALIMTVGAYGDDFSVQVVAKKKPVRAPTLAEQIVTFNKSHPVKVVADYNTNMFTINGVKVDRSTVVFGGTKGHVRYGMTLRYVRAHEDQMILTACFPNHRAEHKQSFMLFFYTKHLEQGIPPNIWEWIPSKEVEESNALSGDMYKSNNGCYQAAYVLTTDNYQFAKRRAFLLLYNTLTTSASHIKLIVGVRSSVSAPPAVGTIDMHFPWKDAGKALKLAQKMSWKME